MNAGYNALGGKVPPPSFLNKVGRSVGYAIARPYLFVEPLLVSVNKGVLQPIGTTIVRFFVKALMYIVAAVAVVAALAVGYFVSDAFFSLPLNVLVGIIAFCLLVMVFKR